MAGRMRRVTLLKWIPAFAGMTVFLSVISLAYAIPPSNVTLAYDTEKGVLRVTAQHPSDRLERYYVRRIDVYKNDALDKTVILPRQTYAWGLDEEIEYKAEPGDQIKVELTSSDGGSADAAVAIPKPVNAGT